MFGEKKKMSSLEQKAKMKALKEANGMASDMLKGHLSGLKKVTVASDSKSGLKEGLKKAEEIVKEEDDSSPFGRFSDDEESQAHEDSESDDEESAEHESGGSEDMLAECDTEEEIDDLIKKLMEKKKSLQA
jgi:hypothetical protein